MDPLTAYVLAEHLMQEGLSLGSFRKPSGQEQLEDSDTINGDVQAEGANVGDAVGCNDVPSTIGLNEHVVMGSASHIKRLESK